VASDHTTAIFAAQLVLLLLCGRLLGEAMARIGQPAIFGQLLAGVLLGPSVFGMLLPDLRQLVFPDTPALKRMIDAVSQSGILLLLLLTGMETNLALVARRRGAVVSTSLSGVLVPFACGLGLAYALPVDLIPPATSRLVTALFLGTALSISSVKIVAMVLLETGALRRDLGQLILATAILDDTLAWIIIAVISGIAAHQTVALEHIGMSLGLTGLFLIASFTVGRRLVARIILWCNDHLSIDVPVISAILIIMLAMALTTELIGVHSALGAFVAGLLIGQSPIVSERIEGELRSFVVAFFSPVFFAVAGLGMDLRTLFEPTLLAFTLGVILVASIGKFAGALVGGLFGGLSRLEALALATGLNARGSTEVIVASIGLSLGALNQELYTMVVAMAVVTTMAMPPTLRWMMARVPLRPDEARRLEEEDEEQKQSLPRLERALAWLDASASGTAMAWLAGLFAARRRVLTTVVELAPAGAAPAGASPGGRKLTEAVQAVLHRLAAEQRPPLDQLVQARPASAEPAIEKEATKGYSIAFVGVAQPISLSESGFEPAVQRLIDAFDGPVALLLNGEAFQPVDGSPRTILVPTTGRPESQLATELALALAAASGAALTVFHVFDPRADTLYLRSRARRVGLSVLVEAHRLGKLGGVVVKGLTATNTQPEMEIRRTVARGDYDIVVLGTSLRRADSKFLGPRALALVRALKRPVLLVMR
jgi:Kef-type K+ transport system membrane component KefB/nucleotide-binding universal stress UspA family protein